MVVQKKMYIDIDLRSEILLPICRAKMSIICDEKSTAKGQILVTEWNEQLWAVVIFGFFEGEKNSFCIPH